MTIGQRVHNWLVEVHKEKDTLQYEYSREDVKERALNTLERIDVQYTAPAPAKPMAGCYATPAFKSYLTEKLGYTPSDETVLFIVRHRV